GDKPCVGQSTVLRWMQWFEFVSELNDARRMRAANVAYPLDVPFNVELVGLRGGQRDDFDPQTMCGRAFKQPRQSCACALGREVEKMFRHRERSDDGHAVCGAPAKVRFNVLVSRDHVQETERGHPSPDEPRPVTGDKIPGFDVQRQHPAGIDQRRNDVSRRVLPQLRRSDNLYCQRKRGCRADRGPYPTARRHTFQTRAAATRTGPGRLSCGSSSTRSSVRLAAFVDMT